MNPFFDLPESVRDAYYDQRDEESACAQDALWEARRARVYRRAARRAVTLSPEEAQTAAWLAFDEDQNDAVAIRADRRQQKPGSRPLFLGELQLLFGIDQGGELSPLRFATL